MTLFTVAQLISELQSNYLPDEEIAYNIWAKDEVMEEVAEGEYTTQRCEDDTTNVLEQMQSKFDEGKPASRTALTNCTELRAVWKNYRIGGKENEE